MALVLNLGCLKSIFSYVQKPESTQELELVQVPNEPDIFILKGRWHLDSMRNPHLEVTRKGNLLLVQVVWAVPDSHYIDPGHPTFSFPFRIDKTITQIAFGQEEFIIWSRVKGFIPMRKNPLSLKLSGSSPNLPFNPDPTATIC